MPTRAIGDVRPSQVITTFGPGAIVDLQTMSVIVAGIDRWYTDEELVIREPRLERALRVKRFFPAKPSEGSFFNKLGTIPGCCKSLCSLIAFRRLSEVRLGNATTLLGPLGSYSWSGSVSLEAR